MNQNSKKEYILQKIDYLIELLETNHESNKVAQKTSLFDDNLLHTYAIRESLIKTDKIDVEELSCLNTYFRRASTMKNLLEQDIIQTYEEYIEEEVKNILLHTKDNWSQKASHFLIEKAVDDVGNIYTPSTATKYVEKIRQKNGIKKK